MLMISLFKVHGEGFHFGNLTLVHYWTVLNSSFTLRAIRNSFILAFSTATLCTMLAMVLSYIEVRTQAKGKGILRSLATMPLSIPGTVFGVGVLLAWSRGLINLYGTLWILLIALMGRFIPFGYQTICASLRQLDPTLEESARISGASWFTTVRKIVIPLLKSGILSAWMLMFMVTMVELAAAIMLFTSGTEPVSVAMFDSFSEGSFQVVSALSILVLSVSLGMYFIFRRLLAGSQRASVRNGGNLPK
jgi:iron(III) transport system permease protein